MVRTKFFHPGGIMKKNLLSGKKSELTDSSKWAMVAAIWMGAAFVSGVALAKEMTAVLQLREKVPMELLANQVMNANGPMTRAYTAQEIRDIVGADEDEYQSTLRALRQEGFLVIAESSSRLSVTVRADHSIFERVFSTQVQLGAQGAQKLTLEPQVPGHLSLVTRVGGIGGQKRHSHMTLRPMDGSLTSSPNQGLDRNTIVNLYGLNSIYEAGNDGSGQTIAVATYGDVNLDAVKALYNYYNLSPMPSVDKVTFNGAPTLDEDAAMETSLDAEFAGMIAPGATIHIFTSATNDDAGELAMFTAILDDGSASVINYSWGGCEAALDQGHAQDMNKVFARAVAQGVNVMVASGDNGSNSCGVGLPGGPAAGSAPDVDADWPSANPYVVGVGGTTIVSSTGSFKEAAWSGSGGGVSKIWPKPNYQGKISAYSMRAYPDVSFNADPKGSPEPVYVIYKGQSGWLPIGGTSMAAPQWSGFVTLVNAARAKAGKSGIGFLNPQIYSLGSSAFHDVTTGSNGAYSAGKGYDPVTGLGSPKADKLFDYLIQR